jgi:hypothetical protein
VFGTGVATKLDLGLGNDSPTVRGSKVVVVCEVAGDERVGEDCKWLGAGFPALCSK